MKKINNTLDKTILRVSLIFGFIIAISIVIYLQTNGKLLDTGSVNYNIENKEQTVIKDLVEKFGQSFKNVYLSSPDVKDTLAQAYQDFVSPELLEQWQQNPSQAPGRIVSSPWPDRIDITSIKKIDEVTYIIYGEIIEITSVEQVQGGIAAKRDIILTITKINNSWLISDVILGVYK